MLEQKQNLLKIYDGLIEAESYWDVSYRLEGALSNASLLENYFVTNFRLMSSEILDEIIASMLKEIAEEDDRHKKSISFLLHDPSFRSLLEEYEESTFEVLQEIVGTMAKDERMHINLLTIILKYLEKYFRKM